MATDSPGCVCDDAFRKTTEEGGVTLHVDGTVLWAELETESELGSSTHLSLSVYYEL